MNNKDEAFAYAKMGAASGGAVISTITLNDWVAIATIGFILLQAGLLVPKYIKMWHDWQAKRRAKK